MQITVASMTEGLAESIMPTTYNSSAGKVVIMAMKNMTVPILPSIYSKRVIGLEK